MTMEIGPMAGDEVRTPEDTVEEAIDVCEDFILWLRANGWTRQANALVLVLDALEVLSE